MAHIRLLKMYKPSGPIPNVLGINDQPHMGNGKPNAFPKCGRSLNFKDWTILFMHCVFKQVVLYVASMYLDIFSIKICMTTMLVDLNEHPANFS